MPLYEYKCLQCNRHTEKIQKFSDPEITLCPYCGGTLERVISAPAISFKGGGWYADGYGNAKPAASGESKATAAPATESKPATGSSSSAPAAAPAAPAASAAPATSAAASSK
jgi:putative FmdB family regulatory protein